MFFLIHCIATFAIVETIHHGSIFKRLRDLNIELINCPFCLSRHIALLLSPFTIMANDLNWWWIPLLMFGGASGSNLINDYFWMFTRKHKE